jgi:hypothetical protein
MARVHLISFAAGSARYEAAAGRFREQAENFGLFDSCTVVTPRSGGIFDRFMAEHGRFVESNARGFGYWIWKPYILSHLLERCPEGDAIVYLDVGFEFSPEGRERFRAWLDLLQKTPILGFSAWNRNEHYYTKRELLDRVRLPEPMLRRSQLQAGSIFLQNSAYARSFVGEWAALCNEEDHFLVTDEKRLSQDRRFIDHRHDQSVYSLLAKRDKVTILPDKTWFPRSLYARDSLVYKIPIHAIRNETARATIVPEYYRSDRPWWFRALKTTMLRAVERARWAGTRRPLAALRRRVAQFRRPTCGR